MDFGFSEEQEMLRDAAKRFLADNCPTTFVRKMMADSTAHDKDFWKKLVDIGWPGLLIPGEYGGQGGSFLDMTVIAEEAGKALVPGPFFTSGDARGAARNRGWLRRAKKDILPQMAKGEFIGTLALAEAAGRFDAEGIQLKATKSGKDYTITGEKFFVPDAHVANGMAVAVAHRRQRRKRHYAPDRAGQCEGRHHHAAQDGRYDAAPVPREVRQREDLGILGKEGEGWPILRRALDIATAGLSAEMVGTAQRALDMSVEYAKTRVQFGKPIGSFQAVKHKCVDMMVAVENARSLTYYACWTVDTNGAEAATAVPMAKAYASDMAKNVTSEAIQVHGGIGFTWEHDMHLYHRRALAGEANLGNAPVHRETVARSLLG